MRRYWWEYHRAAGRFWDLVPPEHAGKPYLCASPVSAMDAYAACYPQEVLHRCEDALQEANRMAQNADVRQRIAFFRDGFEYTRLTAIGFTRWQAYQRKPSEDGRTALSQAVAKRNEFVRRLYARQKQGWPDLPLALEGRLRDLLYGDVERGAMLARPCELRFDSK